MNSKRKEEIDAFLKKPEIDLIYIYHLNPSSPDAALAQLVLDYKKFEASQAHNNLLARQNKFLLILTVVLACAALLQAGVSIIQTLHSSPSHNALEKQYNSPKPRIDSQGTTQGKAKGQ